MVGKDAKARTAATPKAPTLDWYQCNREQVARADELISSNLSDRREITEHTDMSLCDEVFTMMKASLSHVEGSENSSVLLLGEAGSGKTHVIEWCVRQLCEAEQSLVVLRADGGQYSSDVECIRHLATQVVKQLVAFPHRNASFEQGMEWIRNILRESFRHSSAVVIVLDRFEEFCARGRQTLLYNLFDIAQEVGIRMSIVGMSEKMDVMSSLEKRIRSRFSVRQLHAFLPTKMDDLVKLLMIKFHLPPACGLKQPFVGQFHKNVEFAIRAKEAEWAPHLELGRPPSWFLWRCLPISSLLFDACANDVLQQSGAPPPKRARLADPRGSLPSATGEDVKMLLLGALTETEHIILLALLRTQGQKTLSVILHEVQLLHESCLGLVVRFDPDRYCAAFDMLLQKKLVEFCGLGRADTAKRYLTCRSLVSGIYGRFVQDLESSKLVLRSNPLRELPAPIQQWASRPTHR